MQRPTWVTVIGVLLIIFGVLGIFGSGQLIFMPTMIEFQGKMMGIAMENARHSDPEAEQILEEFEQMLDMSGSSKQTIMFMGIISLFITAFYLFSGITMLQMKKNAIKLAYWAIGLSMGFTIIQAFFAMASGSLFFMFMIIGCVISLTIDTVLLLVIILNDKSSFEQPDPRASIPLG